MTHCTMKDLIEIRDGEGSAVAREHLAECDACRVELDRLHQRVAALKALPSLRPPRDRWPLVRDAVSVKRRRARWQRAGLGALAAAAALVGVIAVSSLGPGVAAVSAEEIEALVEESQELERVLDELYRQGRVVDGVTAAAIAELEDRIALVDWGIQRAQAGAASREELANLWRERVTLMDQLVSTHAGRTPYVGY
jgi:hypothetical protein